MDRREFVKNLALGTGYLVLLPTVTACTSANKATKDDTEPTTQPTDATEDAAPVSSSEIPMTRPAAWDPVTYNKQRGLNGAIPESYHADITGPVGDTDHLGKHLPFIPAAVAAGVPAGFVPIMWGDPDKGHAPHPNAPPNESNNHEGHWYNWIRVRKAVDGEAEELQSAFKGWPELSEASNGKYVAADGTDITADNGKNTVYLAALPSDVNPGDTIRIHAHCLTHGEYVDFITV